MSIRSSRHVYVGVPLTLLFAAAWSIFPSSSAQHAEITAAEPAADSTVTPAPDFELITLEGDPFRLSEQQGRVIVLNFWATWCPPCREEIPEFVEMQDDFGRDDVLFVGVSLDNMDANYVRAFADEFNVNYPMMIDDGTADQAYGPVRSLPSTFLIDRDGNVQGYAPGLVTREMLEPLIMNLVAGRSIDAHVDEEGR